MRRVERGRADSHQRGSYLSRRRGERDGTGRAGSRGEYHPVVIRHHFIQAAWRLCPR